MSRTRLPPTEDLVKEAKFAYPAMAYKDDESHGGEDVIIYAKGPWSHLFQSQVCSIIHSLIFFCQHLE